MTDNENKLLNIHVSPDIRPLGVNDFASKSVAVLGMTRSGKSNTVAVLAEEFLQAGLPFVIVDYAGEYSGLKEKYDIYSVGMSVNPETLDAMLLPSSAAELARRSYTKLVSFILDVSGYEPEVREEFLSYFFKGLWNLALTTRVPYTIFLEECQNFIPQQGKTSVTPILSKIAKEGGKRGLGIIMIGQRATEIDKKVITQAQMFFLHRVNYDTDIKLYHKLIPRWKPRETQDKITSLKQGQAYVVWDGNVRHFDIRLRHTPHGGHSPTLDDLPDERGIDRVEDLYR